MGLGRTLGMLELAQGNGGLGTALLLSDRPAARREDKPLPPITEQEKLDMKAGTHTAFSMASGAISALSTAAAALSAYAIPSSIIADAKLIAGQAANLGTGPGYHDVYNALHPALAGQFNSYDAVLTLRESADYIMANAHSAFQAVSTMSSVEELAIAAVVAVSTAAFAIYEHHKANAVPALAEAPAAKAAARPRMSM